MKKYLSFILVLCVMIGISACKKTPESVGSSAETSVVEEVIYTNTQETTQTPSQNQDNSSNKDIVSEKERNSTIIAPITVTFYKDGKQSVSNDKELNYKIARHIEDWYKDAGNESISCNCISTDADVLRLKHNETAIELEFDKDAKFYGGYISSHTRKIFIPLTGEKDYVIFSTGKSAGKWFHYYPNGKGLEVYFEDREYKEISNDRWKSTITAPARIQLYRKGELLEEHTDWDFNLQLAEYIESWYLYETSIDSSEMDMIDDFIKSIRVNDTYVEIFFHSEIKIYGEYLFSPETYCLLIPLTGEYAGFVFEAGLDCNYTKIHCPEQAQKLDHFFETLNTNDNS